MLTKQLTRHKPFLSRTCSDLAVVIRSDLKVNIVPDLTYLPAFRDLWVNILPMIVTPSPTDSPLVDHIPIKK